MPQSPSVYSVLPAQNNDPAASIPVLSAEASFARFSLCWNSPHRQFLLPSFVLHSVALYAPGWQQFRRGSPADEHNFPSSLPSGYNRFSHPFCNWRIGERMFLRTLLGAICRSASAVGSSKFTLMRSARYPVNSSRSADAPGIPFTCIYPLK